MSKRVGYRLAARSPFHIGQRGVGIEETSAVLRSDTLFSALCLTLRELGQDLDAFLARFPRVSGGELEDVRPPFRLSSAFPYAHRVHLLPCPPLPLAGGADPDDPERGPTKIPPRLHKRLKKIRFASPAILEKLLAGETMTGQLLKEVGEDPAQAKIRQDLLLQGGRVWVTAQELERLQSLVDPRSGQVSIWQEHTTPRVTIDRVSSQSQVYGVGRTSFAPDCGLHFLVEYDDESLRPQVEMALRTLGDTGVGGERSSGHGQFELEIIDDFALTEPAPDRANAFALLSLYWPVEAEVKAGALDGASYGLINRRGWISSPDGMNLRRQGVRMLTEGSVLRRRPRGALADVKPLDPAPAANVPHDVWRYGLAFSLRCSIPGKEEAPDES